MAIQHITINQTFNAPVSKVFQTLSDHEQFGRICGISMKRIVDGRGSLNGLGSVREIKIGVLPAFEETITKFIENTKLEYRITKGSPIKNHLGKMVFMDKGEKCSLHYTIALESKIPLTTFAIKSILGLSIKRGLQRYARSLDKK